MMPRNILVLGAGELGTALTKGLLEHRSYESNKTTITVSVRAHTLADLDQNTNSEKNKTLLLFRDQGVKLIALDIIQDSEESLTKVFSSYDTVLHAQGHNPDGSQLKVTRAVLAAKVKTYNPWQHGVNYDLIGREGGLGLFNEQISVRELLRSQSETNWYIISCGIFMSLLFEDWWGVIERNAEGKIKGINALGGWDHLLTATTVEDIARTNAELLFVDGGSAHRNKSIFIASDTMRYDQFADLVEQVVGHPVTREVWSIEILKAKALAEPENKLRKYHLVFSEDVGLAWDKANTYSEAKSLSLDSIEKYMKRMNFE